MLLLFGRSVTSYLSNAKFHSQAPCILLIIHDLKVTLKSVAYLMYPPKRCVVNITLDGSMKYPCLLHNTPWSDQLDFADVDMRKMITCPTEDLICGSKSNLLKMKESPVPITQWFWLSPPVLQQPATCQDTIVFCLHLENFKHVDKQLLWRVLAQVLPEILPSSKHHITSTNRTLIVFDCHSYLFWNICQAVLIYWAPFLKWRFAICCYFFASIQEIQT